MGNAYRSDDGIGPALVDRLRRKRRVRADYALCSGEGAALMALWDGRDRVVVIDAVCSGAPPGTLHRIEAHRQHVPSTFFNYSTHAFSLAEAVELSRTLGTLPACLILFGIEGQVFAAGDRLSGPATGAVDKLARRLPAELARMTAGGVTA